MHPPAQREHGGEPGAQEQERRRLGRGDRPGAGAVNAGPRTGVVSPALIGRVEEPIIAVFSHLQRC